SVAQADYERIAEVQRPTVSLDDLMAAWQSVLQRASRYQHHKVGRAEPSVREHMSFILRRLQQAGLTEFSTLFDVAREGVAKLVVCFLAILELAREGLVRLTQQTSFSPIYLQAA